MEETHYGVPDDARPSKEEYLDKYRIGNGEPETARMASLRDYSKALKTVSEKPFFGRLLCLSYTATPEE